MRQETHCKIKYLNLGNIAFALTWTATFYGFLRIQLDYEYAELLSVLNLWLNRK